MYHALFLLVLVWNCKTACCTLQNIALWLLCFKTRELERIERDSFWRFVSSIVEICPEFPAEFHVGLRARVQTKRKSPYFFSISTPIPSRTAAPEGKWPVECSDNFVYPSIHLAKAEASRHGPSAKSLQTKIVKPEQSESLSSNLQKCKSIRSRARVLLTIYCH